MASPMLGVVAEARLRMAYGVGMDPKGPDEAPYPTDYYFSEKSFDIDDDEGTINVKFDAVIQGSPPECIVCSELIDVSDSRKLQCGHDAFHDRCISKWFEYNDAPTCPMCRADDDEPEDEPEDEVGDNEEVGLSVVRIRAWPWQRRFARRS
jgi:hypothetical protein